jgi:hypothetical protein
MRNVVLLLILCLSAVPGAHAEDVFTDHSAGTVVYFPTLAQADRIIEDQLSNGLVPEHRDSAVVTAEDSAGKLLVLAAAYRYTGNTRYLDARERLERRLEAVNSSYGYMPQYMRIDGSPLTVHDDGGIVADALALAGMIEARNLSRTVTLEDTVIVGCLPLGDNASEDEGGGDGESCPFEVSSGEGEVSPPAVTYVYAEGADRALTVTYTVPYSALSESTADIQIDQVVTVVDNEEIQVSPGDCLSRGIKAELIDGLRVRVLGAVARDVFSSPEMKRGFAAISPGSVRAPAERLAYQARLVVEAGGTVPWDLVEHGNPALRDYAKLAEEYSLLQGAMYLPGLARDNATVSYEVPTGEDLAYSLHSTNLDVSGREVSYNRQDLEPKVESLWVKWHPVRDRRVHVAGSFSSFLSSKFGVSLHLGDPLRDEVVTVTKVPSGEYEVTVNRDRVFPEEELDGTVKVWRPETAGPDRATVVQYPTMDAFQSTRAYQKAVENEDPEQFFVAVDNLLIHMTGAGRADLDSGVPGVVKALYSLSEEDIEEVARHDSKLRRTLFRWREYYARMSLDKVRELIAISLREDTYSRELEDLLWRLSTEANATGLASAAELEDLYAGYRGYWGPHTKDYANLVPMAKHLQEYREIVEAIEDSDFERAEEMVRSLPGNSTVRRILEDQVEAGTSGLRKDRNSAFETARDVLDGRGSIDGAITSLEGYVERAGDDSEARFVLGTLVAYRDGVISRDKAREALSDMEPFDIWATSEQHQESVPPATPRPTETYQPTARSQPEGDNTAAVVTLVLLAVTAVVTAVIYRKRREGVPRRR